MVASEDLVGISISTLLGVCTLYLLDGTDVVVVFTLNHSFYRGPLHRFYSERHGNDFRGSLVVVCIPILPAVVVSLKKYAAPPLSLIHI